MLGKVIIFSQTAKPQTEYFVVFSHGGGAINELIHAERVNGKKEEGEEQVDRSVRRGIKL
jgi:hypothetical protein